MPTPYVRAHIIVSGVVQGVGFRFFAIARARQLQLNGYVRNLPSGKVETEVEGARGLVTDFINELKVGPASARVTDVAVAWKEYTGAYRSFDLHHTY